MSIDDLIAASNATVVTEDDVKRRKKRLSEAEQRFAEETKIKENDPAGFLRKEYTL